MKTLSKILLAAVVAAPVQAKAAPDQPFQAGPPYVVCSGLYVYYNRAATSEMAQSPDYRGGMFPFSLSHTPPQETRSLRAVHTSATFALQPFISPSIHEQVVYAPLAGPREVLAQELTPLRATPDNLRMFAALGKRGFTLAGNCYSENPSPR